MSAGMAAAMALLAGTAQARQMAARADLTRATAVIHDARDDGPRNRGENRECRAADSSAKAAAAPATVGG